MAGFLLVILYFAMAALAAAIVMQPNNFVVARSAVIDAPPDEVFSHINDLHKWRAWSPWARLDPNATNRFEGPEAGAGASLDWSGNNKIGAGRMTILDSRPSESVAIKLDFRKPFKASNDVSFRLAPEPDARTKVTWTMSGRNTLIAKAMNLVMNFDKMIGGQFESGLANLNAVFAK